MEMKIKKSLLRQALELVKPPLLIAIAITPIRYCLELTGLSENIIFLIGLLWFTIGVSIYWGIKLYKIRRHYVLLLFSLCILSPISRIPVAIAWWVDSHWGIGTHYGQYFSNFGQALLNHIVYGSFIQIIPGYLVGVITIIVMQRKKVTVIKN
ncbi:hypothetical protein SAMN04487906_2159 [Zhouia amylolytica]|uniref:Uncharacterized protein n=1 Tax=Zhouia amylolytica TaxID=376730 RepID=A0A1I6TUI6_9FLAO|nr:hypothetical protein [Zhouia amylolytica]MCQ0112559.1 hypothetical protein [Zhouia amylolytica]SFS92903.1 hypothetical protein SAMN04487906_2159 [Zhouia amylolytica]